MGDNVSVNTDSGEMLGKITGMRHDTATGERVVKLKWFYRRQDLVNAGAASAVKKHEQRNSKVHNEVRGRDEVRGRGRLARAPPRGLSNTCRARHSHVSVRGVTGGARCGVHRSLRRCFRRASRTRLRSARLGGA